MITLYPLKRPIILGVLLVLPALIAPARPSWAAPGPAAQSLSSQTAEEKPVRRVELLVLEDRPSEITVGLHIELRPGWYLYWLNPGDAGLPPEVRWQLPAGLKAGSLRFPTPQKFVHGDITAYGFTDEVLILCDIERPAGSEAMHKPVITAVLNWMACRESCITGEAPLRADLSGLAAADIRNAGRLLSRFSPRFPKSMDASRLSANGARLIKSPGGWRIEILIDSGHAARVSDFYPYPLRNFVIAHHRIAMKEGKLVIPVEPSNPAATLSRISGLFIIDGAGFEVSIPVKE